MLRVCDPAVSLCVCDYGLTVCPVQAKSSVVAERFNSLVVRELAGKKEHRQQCVSRTRVLLCALALCWMCVCVCVQAERPRQTAGAQVSHQTMTHPFCQSPALPSPHMRVSVCVCMSKGHTRLPQEDMGREGAAGGRCNPRRVSARCHTHAWRMTLL